MTTGVILPVEKSFYIKKAGFKKDFVIIIKNVFLLLVLTLHCLIKHVNISVIEDFSLNCVLRDPGHLTAGVGTNTGEGRLTQRRPLS